MSIQLNQIPRSITESSQNESTSVGHTHAIDKASVTQAGIVKLVDNLDSKSKTEALTANQEQFKNNNRKTTKYLT